MQEIVLELGNRQLVYCDCDARTYLARIVERCSASEEESFQVTDRHRMSFLPDVVDRADDLQFQLLRLEIGYRLRAGNMMLLEPLR